MHRWIKSSGLLLFGLLTGCQGPSFTVHRDAKRAGAELGTIRGVILDSVSGKPFKQVGVSLHFHDSSSSVLERKVTADANGAFRFSLIPNGSYTINKTASAPQDCPYRFKYTGCIHLQYWSQPDCQFELTKSRVFNTDTVTGQTYIFLLVDDCNYPDYIVLR